MNFLIKIQIKYKLLYHIGSNHSTSLIDTSQILVVFFKRVEILILDKCIILSLFSKIKLQNIDSLLTKLYYDQ